MILCITSKNNFIIICLTDELCYIPQSHNCNFEYFMGQCASPTPPHRHNTYHFECQPAGTEALKNKQLPKLIFHSNLANVKIKNYPYKKAIPLFKVREGEIFTLAAKDCDEQNTIAWKIYETFDFQMTEYELRKQFLEVSIQNQKNEQVATVKINLFLITTGPHQQDFALHFPKNKIGRISFDLKISQIIDLKIQSKFTQLCFSKKHPGQEFCYSIKKINGFSGNSIESETSYPAMVLLQTKNKEHSRNLEEARPYALTRDASYGTPSNDSPLLPESFGRKKSKRQSIIQIEEGGQLKWTKEGGDLPAITTKVVASQLHNSYFQILVWKYQGNQQSTREVFVDCYVSFYKLLGTQPSIVTDGVKEYQSRSINITEKIEHLGKVYGQGSFQFTITNEAYFKQYQLCVHTEVGILKTSPIFGIQETKATDKSLQLNDILAINHLVEQNIIALNKLESDEGTKQEIRYYKAMIEEELQQIFKLLQQTSDPPSFLYTYNSQKELLEGQKILVQLGMKITQYIQSQDPTTNDLCWLILISLIKRGQFNLSHMGFSDKQKKNIEANNINQLLLFKQEVANIYKVFLYKMLDLALNSIDHKGSQYQRTFAQIFSAYAYFRIPEFRKKILILIAKQSDPQINQWRGVDFNLQDDIQQGGLKDKGNIFSEMFDWERHFYKWLVRNQQIQSENITLHQILAQKNWKQRFVKRGLAFFYFIKYWVTYVDSSLPNSRDVQWNYFPGYNRLLKGFFVQLKTIPILQYPDALIDAGLKLLSNFKLLNPFFKILLNKVYVFDTSAVIRVIEYLNMILQAVGARHKHLPFSFNYSFFFKALTIIFQSDFSMSVSAALTLIYTNFDIFHFEFRKSISMYFLGSAFNKLFLHWSHHVRQVFYHLLTYRIYGDALKVDSSTIQRHSPIQNQDILNRYQDIMKILAFEVQNYQVSKIPALHPSFDKSLFKKMKLKIYERLSGRQNRMPQPLMPKSENQYNKSADSNCESDFKAEMPEEQFIKKERCYSEAWSSGRITLVRRESQHNVHKKEEIKRMSRYNQFSYQHEHVGKISSLFHQIIPQSEFAIRDIDKKSLKLIENCLKSYRKIEADFIKGIESGMSKAPLIKQEISIDKREIRPKQFDDW